MDDMMGGAAEEEEDFGGLMVCRFALCKSHTAYVSHQVCAQKHVGQAQEGEEEGQEGWLG
jgi:hypothetical protein